MSSSNCCFLTCIQISQRQVRWSDIPISQNFLQFIVIHPVKCFDIFNKEEIDVFLELSSFFNDSVDVGNLISGFVPLLNSGWTSVISWFLCVLNRTLFSSYSLHCFKIVWSIFRTSITVCILITLEFLSDRVLSCTNILSSTSPFFHPDRSWLGMTVPVILLHSTLILDCSD